MNFVKHENFPDFAANLVRHLEWWQHGETILKFPEELYGEGVKPQDWLGCVGNQAKAHRPTILSMDSGIKFNAVTMKVMRESGCSFVMLQNAWAEQSSDSFAWRILKAWRDIRTDAEAAAKAGRQCKIDVSIMGKRTIVNL